MGLKEYRELQKITPQSNLERRNLNLAKRQTLTTITPLTKEKIQSFNKTANNTIQRALKPTRKGPRVNARGSVFNGFY